MVDRVAWLRRLAEAAASPEGSPLAICRLCVDTLEITGAGISMVTGSGNRGVVCATDDRSAHVEELQLVLGEGPCVDAVRSGGPVLIHDLHEPVDLATERWPTFIEGVAAVGIQAVFAFPLRIGAISVGALDLYRDTPGELSDHELPAALLAADAAALALLQRTEGGHRPVESDGGLAGRELQVHQATGMVQVQMGVTTEAALLALRARAFADSRSLADVSRDVVARRLRFSLEDR